MSLSKIKTIFIKQDHAAFKKVWYHALKGDLFLWKRKHGEAKVEYGGDEAIALFQVAFTERMAGDEYMFEWEKGDTFRLGRVDSGDVPGGMSLTPVVDLQDIGHRSLLSECLRYFEKQSTAVSPEMREFILQKIALAVERAKDLSDGDAES